MRQRDALADARQADADDAFASIAEHEVSDPSAKFITTHACRCAGGANRSSARLSVSDECTGHFGYTATTIQSLTSAWSKWK